MERGHSDCRERENNLLAFMCSVPSTHPGCAKCHACRDVRRTHICNDKIGLARKVDLTLLRLRSKFELVCGRSMMGLVIAGVVVCLVSSMRG